MAVSMKKVEKLIQKKKVDKLLKVLPDVDTELRVAIIKGLGRTDSEKAMHVIITYLRDPEVSIRYAAVEALGNMANGRSLEFVRQMWDAEIDAEIREKAVWAIKEIKAKMQTMRRD